MMALFGNQWIQTNKITRVYAHCIGYEDYLVRAEILGRDAPITISAHFSTEEEALDKAKNIAKLIDECDD